MEEAFQKLKDQGKTDVDSLISWMKESKVIDDAKTTEEKVRKLFSDAADKQSVELAKFKEALAKTAEEQARLGKKNIEDFQKSLAEAGPQLLNALMAGANAFKEAMATAPGAAGASSKK